MGKSNLLSERKPKRTVDIHMFTAGDQISSTGQKISFSPDDLNQVVETYHPQQHEAPLIVGHDQDDATPSLGWVKKVWRKGKELWGKIELTPKAEQLIEDGVFKKVSSSFYLPEAETNPYPGKLSLRHLALVTIPAVKGLAAFSEDDEGVITVELSENNNFKLFKEALGIDSSSTMTKKKTLTEDFGEGMTININIGGKPKMEGEDGEPIMESGPAADVSDVNLDEEDLDDDEMFEDEDEDEDSDDEDSDSEDSEDEDDEFEDDDLDLDSEDEDEDEVGEDDFDMDSEDEDSEEDGDMDLEDLDSDSEDSDVEDIGGEDEDTASELASKYSVEELEKALQMKKEEEGETNDNYEYLEDSKSGRVSSYAEKTSKKSEETPKATATIEKKSVELSPEAKALQAKVAKLEEELARQKRVAREKEIGSFAEGLYSGGKLTEQVVSKENLVKFMSSLNYKGAVNFSEGSRSTQLEFFKNMLESLPSMVNFEEVATPASAPKKSGGANFAEPAAAGYAYDSKNLDLHQQALSYSESNSVDYVTALKTILSR